MIPRRLVRTVPEQTTDEVERLWDGACALHLEWMHVTLRDPVNRGAFPFTSPYWDRCENGAQLADLIRVEELHRRGGVYLDSDVEVWQPFDALLPLHGFAGQHDPAIICNAVMGFEPYHPALSTVLQLAVERLSEGTFASGLQTITEVLRDRDDVLVLPPASFYPYHWIDRDDYRTPEQRDRLRRQNPWTFCVHHWHGSWHGPDFAAAAPWVKP